MQGEQQPTFLTYPLFYLPFFAPRLTHLLPPHYPQRSPHYSKFLFALFLPLSLSCLHPSNSPLVICPCSPPPLSLCDPSLPSCQSLLFLAAQWPGQAGAPGLQAARVMTANTGPHTLSGNMWRSACHTCPQLHCAHTHAYVRTHTHKCHDSLCMDNCQTALAVTLDSAKVSDEAQWSRNTPFPIRFLCACKTMSFFFSKGLYMMCCFYSLGKQ